MSLIFITHHDENIYDITKTQSDRQKKSPKYVSKFRDAGGKSALKSGSGAHGGNQSGGLHVTMGLPEQEPPDAHNFLKKRTGKPSYTVKVPGKQRRVKVRHKAQTPLVKDLLEAAKLARHQLSESQKDFVRDNVKNVRQMKPKEPQHKIVVDRMGTTMDPEAQGLEPVYINKPIFGKTPKYLVRFNKIKEKEYQMRKDLSGKQQPKCHYITRDEREQLLQGLKKNWEELQKQYQGLPILTDTIPKKVKKSKLEADLRQLEKDIVLVERHPYIYVYSDAEFLS